VGSGGAGVDVGAAVGVGVRAAVGVGVRVRVGRGVWVGVRVMVGVGVGGYRMLYTSRSLRAASTWSQPSMANTFRYCSKASARFPAA
jgi:hypothetical protein